LTSGAFAGSWALPVTDTRHNQQGEPVERYRKKKIKTVRCMVILIVPKGTRNYLFEMKKNGKCRA
jgi:hypothetical protein